MITTATIVFWLSLALLAYHHAGYPLALGFLAARKRARSGGEISAPTVVGDPSVQTDDTRSSGLRQHGDPREVAGHLASADPTQSLTIIVPAHNEEAVIQSKIANLANLLYPRDALQIVIALDGCTDRTEAIADACITELAPEDAAVFQLDVVSPNQGKLAVLNTQIAKATSDIVVLSDASATVEPDALWRVADHFRDPDVGVVCGTYALVKAGSEGEGVYWSYQTRVKQDEAEIAAPMGAHGAFYAFRRAPWHPLATGTINDDFVLPMQIVLSGYRAVYDTNIVATELETTTDQQEFGRRVRIGAGNLQQALKLWRLADLRRPGLAFLFLSGKGMRPFIPLIAFFGLIAGLVLAANGDMLAGTLVALGLAGVALAGFLMWLRPTWMPGKLATFVYLVQGHVASLIGAVKLLTGQMDVQWSKAPAEKLAETSKMPEHFLPWSVAVSKRAFDIVCGLAALLVLAIIYVPLAILIKRDSPGPVFYFQQRVGRATHDKVEFFNIIKFRSMPVDAEKDTGAVLASEGDNRATKLGTILRKYRIDELPQCINVLRGEMSVIGPRPERPEFFRKYETEIPYYAERCYGLRPGITGLAQVFQKYDKNIEDVRRKVGFDHAYALKLTSWVAWLRTDLSILLRTVTTMALGKGL